MPLKTPADGSPDQPAPPPSSSTARVPALQKGIQILRLLAESPTPHRASTISQRLGIPRSTTFQLLNVLIDEGLVARVREGQSYQLAAAIADLGSAYSMQSALDRIGTPLVERVSRLTGHTTHLAILYGNEILYLTKSRPARPVHLVTEVGVRLPAHLTATGRAILCHMSETQVAALFAASNNLIDRTGNGPKTLAQLRKTLASERRQGWSIERESVTRGFASVAAAVLNHNGMPTASIGVTMPERRAADADLSAVVRHVTAAASTLTQRLGGPVAAERPAV